MIPLANTTTQVKFNYVNMPVSSVILSPYQTQTRQYQTYSQPPIKIQQNIRTSEQKLYKLEGYSSLQLETRKNLPTQKKITQGSIKGLQSIPFVQSTSLLQTHQSLHKAQELDPVKQSISPRVLIPVLKAQNVKSDAPKFKIDGLQEIRESDFFKNNNNDAGNNTFNTSGQQTNQTYNRNPYSNLYSRGGQTQQSDSGHHHHGKRIMKQIKTFKIDKIEEKKESEFTGCCGFGITNKVAFLSKDK